METWTRRLTPWNASFAPDQSGESQMRMRNVSLSLVLALVTVAVVGTAVAYAKNGADDPAGHVSGGHGAGD
jgi:hypothetical protein